MDNNDYKNIKNPESTKWADYPQRISLLVMFIVTVIFNVLTSTGVIGKTQKELSDKYMTLITPPGYAFSIWGVIYFFWAAFIVLQFFPNKFLSQPQMFYQKSFKGNSRVNLIFRIVGLAQFGSFVQCPLVHHVFSRYKSWNGSSSVLDFRLFGLFGGKFELFGVICRLRRIW